MTGLAPRPTVRPPSPRVSHVAVRSSEDDFAAGAVGIHYDVDTFGGCV